jgi:hypothetical protein
MFRLCGAMRRRRLLRAQSEFALGILCIGAATLSHLRQSDAAAIPRAATRRTGEVLLLPMIWRRRSRLAASGPHGWPTAMQWA